jgi:hypothetical protein
MCTNYYSFTAFKVKLINELSEIGCKSSISFDSTSIHLYQYTLFIIDFGCSNTEDVLQNVICLTY